MVNARVVGDILAGIVQIIVAASVNWFVYALIRRAQDGLFAPTNLLTWLEESHFSR
jgi:hypothetical protein